ncbi:hypothetical protein G647_09497 [Cladophialophora carrionii CBS 160.54]|uniref:Uncharacterized protein n=1 Tax=Cladophialophora carrionii CBS 160.54 TaxID=1279043 RepID=V9DMX3_9EURO|nr:uncharacterized protein G647_09497 [Cladophialophora carrionii CBS 160.54]ETI27307.1 hypothetical protein G647_09497 [Cladophialophora carrionii CBS 160.54]
MAATKPFDTGHNDRVTVIHSNFNGTKILTGSIDHRIKVWKRDSKTGETTLVDTFTAHDADIKDAKFLSPTLGTHLVTTGNDLKCHLWSEDATQPPLQGHRFRRVATIQSTPRVPFVSLDVKTLTTDHITTFLALIDRLGLLSIYEPSNPDDLREWTLLDTFNVCTPNAVPSRGDETSFKVQFDPNPTPLPYMMSVNDERDQLGLVVCALNEVKIFRGMVPSATGTGTGGGGGGAGDGSIGGIGLGIGGGSGVSSTGGASHRIMFYEAINLPVHPALVRDVAWAPFSVRGTDRIATACKDGGVRVFELGVAEGQNANGNNNDSGNGGRNGTERHQSAAQARNTVQQRQQQQSSLTSAITGRQTQASSTQMSSQAGGSRTIHDFGYLTTLSSFTTLPQAHTDAWSVTFDGQGQVLLSQGSDGVTKLWRKSVLNGQWMVFAGQDITEDSDESDEDDDEDEEVNELGGLNL